ncbi:MAG: class II aldolase/adducin family protein, partial [Clostridia bacterium]|nr:class II aldolase/adducin family protein [Clostridia bacterium]
MNDCKELRKEVIDTCLWLKSQGLLFSTWGNISVRLDDGNILITPSKVDYDIMMPEDLVVLSPEGKQISGTRLSTSEREIHRRVMNKRA